MNDGKKEWTIRLATDADCCQLAVLKQKMWQETYTGIYSDEKINAFDFAAQAEKFKELVQHPHIALYVVFDQGEPVGYMSCGYPMRPFMHYTQEIGLLYLLKAYQGRGIGKQLFLLGRDKIRQSGVKEFFISCNRYNLNAIAFYKKCGGQMIAVHHDLDKSNAQVKFLYQIK